MTLNEVHYSTTQLNNYFFFFWWVIQIFTNHRTLSGPCRPHPQPNEMIVEQAAALDQRVFIVQDNINNDWP